MTNDNGIIGDKTDVPYNKTKYMQQLNQIEK